MDIGQLPRDAEGGSRHEPREEQMIGVSHSTGLHVRLFGEPRVESARGVVALSPHQLALVIVVYGHGSAGVSRARAAELLWGDEVAGVVRQRLRQLLSDVRRRAGTSLIDAQADRLKPRPGVPSDLDQLQRALEERSLVRAAEIASRGFVRGAFDRATDALLDWRDSVGEGLGRQVRAAASAVWSSAVASGDWSTARDAAEALYLFDPAERCNVQRVIEARAYTGRIEAAEAAFASYCEACGGSDGVTSEVTQAIQRARQLGRSGLNRRTDSDEVPLVGRASALAAARTVFDHLQDERFGFVLISGESGIGKTRLLKEVRREALVREIRCLDAEAVELESRMPLTPLVDALEGVDLAPHLSALGRPWNAVVAAVLPAQAGIDPLADLPPVQDSALSRRLLDALFLLLERLAQEQPTIFFLDDLQWADATTIAALQFVQRRWVGGPLGVVATVRPELVSDADPLATCLSRIDDLVIKRVELRELSAEEALALVHRIGGGQLSGEIAERICALAGPHPLFLTELTKDFLAGRLKLPVLPVDELSIPVSLREILDTRIGGLTPTAIKVAGFLAVAARPLRLEFISALAHLTQDDAADAVEELSRCRLVAMDMDRVAIGHELFRSAIYQQMGVARAAVRHKAFASLLAVDANDESMGELALHYSRAGERGSAARCGRRAAERAMKTGAVAEAAYLLQLVVDCEDDVERRAEAIAARARALYLARDMAPATSLLEVAAVQLRALDRRSEALRLDIKRIEGLAEVRATDLADLLRMLRLIKGEARAHADWEAVALALDVELQLLHRHEDFDAIAGVLAEMTDVSRKGSLEACLLANTGLAMAVLFGDPDEALAAGQRAVELATPGRPYRLKALLRLMVVLQYRGMLWLPAYATVVEEARLLARRSGDVLLRCSIESNLAVALLDSGDLDNAETMLIQSSALLGEGDMALTRCNQASNWAELALAQGDYTRAQHHYEEVLSHLSATTPNYLRESANAGLGLCAINRGDLSEGRRRDELLSEMVQRWYFDPTVILTFRSRMLELRGRADEALNMLGTHAADLQDRLVFAWLKVQLLRARILRRRGHQDEAAELATHAASRASSLGLAFRAAELEMIASRR